MSRVDVIIPCYNYARFLGECVESVLEQPGVDVRALIIDDASSDNTAEVAGRLAAANSRVTFIRHPQNRGHIVTANEGLRWATADYCLLLSADDMLTPGALRRAANVMDLEPSVGFTYGASIKTASPNRLPAPLRMSSSYRVEPGQRFFEKMCSTGANSVDTPTAVVRTKLQKQIGGYRPELPHAGDMEMWLRFAIHADVAIVDAHQAVYRLHGNNMSLGYTDVRDLRQRREAFDAIFREYNVRSRCRYDIRSVATRALAKEAVWSACMAHESGDLRRCHEFIEFATETWGRTRWTSNWWKLRARLLLGRETWGALRKLMRRARI